MKRFEQEYRLHVRKARGHCDWHLLKLHCESNSPPSLFHKETHSRKKLDIGIVHANRMVFRSRQGRELGTDDDHQHRQSRWRRVGNSGRVMEDREQWVEMSPIAVQIVTPFAVCAQYVTLVNCQGCCGGKLISYGLPLDAIHGGEGYWKLRFCHSF